MTLYVYLHRIAYGGYLAPRVRRAAAGGRARGGQTADAAARRGSRSARAATRQPSRQPSRSTTPHPWRLTPARLTRGLPVTRARENGDGTALGLIAHRLARGTTLDWERRCAVARRPAWRPASLRCVQNPISDAVRARDGVGFFARVCCQRPYSLSTAACCSETCRCLRGTCSCALPPSSSDRSTRLFAQVEPWPR
jgi:hypothetical protein